MRKWILLVALGLLAPRLATAAITGVTVSSVGSYSATITWTSSGTEKTDRVYYGALSGGSCPTLTTYVQDTNSCTTTHSVTVTGLLANTTYCFRPNGLICAMSTRDNSAATVQGTTNAQTATPTFTATLTSSPTPTATGTYTATPSATISNTFTPTFTATLTSTPTLTASPTPSWTNSPVLSPTSTFTSTFTATLTSTPTKTFTPTTTPTPTFTATPTGTPTWTPTSTPTAISGGQTISEWEWDASVDSGTVGAHNFRLVAGTLLPGSYVYQEDIVVTDTALVDSDGLARLAIGVTGSSTIFSGPSQSTSDWNATTLSESLSTGVFKIVDASHAIPRATITGSTISTGKIRLILKSYKPVTY